MRSNFEGAIFERVLNSNAIKRNGKQFKSGVFAPRLEKLVFVECDAIVNIRSRHFTFYNIFERFVNMVNGNGSYQLLGSHIYSHLFSFLQFSDFHQCNSKRQNLTLKILEDEISINLSNIFYRTIYFMEV